MTAASKARDKGMVVTYSERPDRSEHEHGTHVALASRLADLLGMEFAGPHDPGRACGRRIYFVPADTIVGRDKAARLGIRGESDLFGGVVGQAYMATKSITHPLPERAARMPRGWSAAFARQVRDAVLAGLSAFSPEAAGRRLLRRGAVRIKPAGACAGRGQSVARDEAELDRALAGIDAAELARLGLVLEEHLEDVETYSVGQVRVGDLVASYFGTQRLTADAQGAMVYGGSRLAVFRGGFDALPARGLDEPVRRAIACARAYDAAAMRCFPGLLASRRNYDVARGRDAQGRLRVGVLEQSWRPGGASSAEILALEAFQADPALPAVRTASVEVYGEGGTPPPGAVPIFRGTDRKAGPMTKYAMVESDGNEQ